MWLSNESKQFSVECEMRRLGKDFCQDPRNSHFGKIAALSSSTSESHGQHNALGTQSRNLSFETIVTRLRSYRSWLGPFY
jgi:hypothetical protein